MTIKRLSETTPITLALALTLCYVCYWIGAETAAMRVRLDAYEQTQRQLAEIVDKLSGLADGNSRRIDKVEQRLPDK